jgi:hypothetical protein
MRRHFSRRSLHLLWTVPLAFAPALVPVWFVIFERCGITECLGDPGGFASPSASSAVYVALGAGILMFAALVLTPWLRPIWLRLSAALGLSALLAVFWIWYVLFSH